jgi:hypothetical protein
MPKPKRNARRVDQRSPDSPAVEFLTVGWMLSVITALVCELAFAGVRGYLLAVDGESPRMEMLAAVLVFAAVVVGLISLALAFAVVKAGRTPPPRGILTFSIVVGVLPLAAMVLRFLIAGSTSSPIP